MRKLTALVSQTATIVASAFLQKLHTVATAKEAGWELLVRFHVRMALKAKTTQTCACVTHATRDSSVTSSALIGQMPLV